MKYKGINYDTGTTTITGKSTREKFDLQIVAKEIAIIKNELHCNAIRISGIDIERIVATAEIALQEGLSVWFSPSLHYHDIKVTGPYILNAAERAEELRKRYQHIIFVTGCEMSLFTAGFVKGDDWSQRVKKMFSPWSILKNQLGIRRTYNKRLNKFLGDISVKIRGCFHGAITYASGTWEKVDWSVFDITGVDLYRSAFNKKLYRDQLRIYKNEGKPLAIMEFGCCAYIGADEKGAMGWAIVDWNPEIPVLKEKVTPDEHVQSGYIIDLLHIFEKETVHAAFVFTFISNNYTYSSDPMHDLDLGAFGIVRKLEENNPGYKNLPWQPKDAFYKLGEYYGCN